MSGQERSRASEDRRNNDETEMKARVPLVKKNKEEVKGTSAEL